MKKIIFTLLIFIFSISIVKADQIIDLNKKGTITLTLFEEKDKLFVEGAEIEIIKIGNADIINNNLAFNYVDELSDCNVKLDEENIYNIGLCLNEKKLKSNISKTNNLGKTVFDNLDLGIYYVRQINKVDKFSCFSPFLIMLPEEINNEWSYSINGSPKMEIASLIDLTIKKVWNTDKESKILDKVTVELYKGNELIETVVLNEENNWMYTITDLIKSYDYHIKEINVPKGYTVSYSNNDFVYIVTNTPSLVQTGQMTYIPIMISFIGLIFVIIGFILLKVEKNEK